MRTFPDFRESQGEYFRRHLDCDEPIIVILTAIPDEMEAVKERLTNKNEHSVQGLRFTTGLIHEKPCVVALMGMGKVNAAMTAAILIEYCKPCEVICMGVGGGLDPILLPGDIVIAEKIAQHDYGKFTLNGFQIWRTRDPTKCVPNPLFIPADAKLLELAEAVGSRIELSKVRTGDGERTPRIIKGSIVTGDVAVIAQSKRTELREIFQADAVDMEGAAVSQVCWRLGVAHLVIRGISDACEEHLERDWKVYLRVASKNAAELATAVVSEYGRG